MIPYHKIHSVFKRDDQGNFLLGVYSNPSFEYLQNNIWSWDEKIDGTNIRISFNGSQIKFGGRTDRAIIPPTLLAHLESLLTIEQLKEQFPSAQPDRVVTLYGEGYGNKIQKVGRDYIPDGVGFILFDIQIGRWWMTEETLTSIASSLGLKQTPKVGVGTISEAIQLVSKGFKSQIGTCDSEGLILRPLPGLLDRSGQRIITKIKTRDFGGIEVTKKG